MTSRVAVNQSGTFALPGNMGEGVMVMGTLLLGNGNDGIPDTAGGWGGAGDGGGWWLGIQCCG